MVIMEKIASYVQLVFFPKKLLHLALLVWLDHFRLLGRLRVSTVQRELVVLSSHQYAKIVIQDISLLRVLRIAPNVRMDTYQELGQSFARHAPLGNTQTEKLQMFVDHVMQVPSQALAIPTAKADATLGPTVSWEELSALNVILDSIVKKERVVVLFAQVESSVERKRECAVHVQQGASVAEEKDLVTSVFLDFSLKRAHQGARFVEEERYQTKCKALVLSAMKACILMLVILNVKSAKKALIPKRVRRLVQHVMLGRLVQKEVVFVRCVCRTNSADVYDKIITSITKHSGRRSWGGSRR
jgi:hypothetical protein